MTEPRIGLGFDVHASGADGPLMLAGVRFDGEHRLAGHSDGDVVCHAVAESLLGAAALGDLGDHFPDDDPATEGIAGLELLERSARLVNDVGFRPGSCDATVIAERPSIRPRRAEMREKLARALGIPIERVSVKATRPEGLGLSGDGAGCIAIAVLVER
jgi:2-C-methyl-D-erythritol 2,4-cyclodiphosphate synthase